MRRRRGGDRVHCIEEARVGVLALDAHRRGEVEGTDEQYVDAVDARDRVGLLEPAGRLDLDHGEQLAVGALEVGVEIGAEPGGAGERCHAAHALRGIAHRSDRFPGLVGRLDVRYHHTGNAQIEHPLESDRVVPRDPDDRRGTRGVRRLDLSYEALLVSDTVLVVHEDPVETGPSGHFDRDARSQIAPGPEEPFTRGDPIVYKGHSAPGSECTAGA